MCIVGIITININIVVFEGSFNNELLVNCSILLHKVTALTPHYYEIICRYLSLQHVLLRNDIHSFISSIYVFKK